ncbi:MAG TPA: diguanylate cyclase [Terriglobales bacterium]|jgi:diguanylate cyclase (GGDEF)-like protein|nr:diguanylate cyclase [Terriglobales bacterium]
MEITELQARVAPGAAAKPGMENWPVIVAEGDKARRLAMLAWLKDWAYRAMPAVNGEHALELLRQPGGSTLALVGQKLRGLDGPELCRKIKRRRSLRTYVVLLAGREQEVAAGLEAGADDCLQDPFQASDLQMRLRVGQRMLQLRQQLEAAQKALKFGTTHDALTGIFNRDMIASTLDRELARALRTKKALGILKIDLCHLREINRLHGHTVGDAVLQEVAQRLRSSLRAYDTVGRYGAEEFLVVIPEIAPENLASVITRLRSSVTQLPVNTGAGPVSIAVSMGASGMAAGTQGLGAHFLLHAADVALYLSRRNGRNCVRVCGSEDRVLVSS